MQGFSLLSHRACAIAITNRLTGTQFRLWLYLMMIDPFADQTGDGERIYHSIPSPREIALAIGASERTVEKDMKRLEKLGLYAKRVTGWAGYNLSVKDAQAASAAIKQAKTSREGILQPPAPAKRLVKLKKRPKPLQDKSGYLAAPETQAQQGESPKPLQDLGGYLAAQSGYLAGGKNAETKTEQVLQASAILPQTIQTSTDSEESVEEDPDAIAPEGGIAPVEEKEEAQKEPNAITPLADCPHSKERTPEEEVEFVRTWTLKKVFYRSTYPGRERLEDWLVGQMLTCTNYERIRFFDSFKYHEKQRPGVSVSYLIGKAFQVIRKGLQVPAPLCP